ncbi:MULTISPECIES: hypothetical protein [Piscinibacter]|uniref:hypothetical protein n=1 Tax=Piscinibacter TaxID=1114981 RepID=UPI000FDD1246|nr:hypothetical protein [Piscinibacter defluvii]
MNAAVEWYHGTDARFTDWQFPPPPLPEKKGLRPHSAVFLTSDLTLASAAGQHLCTAQLQPSARILDLRRLSAESDTMRQAVGRAELGNHCLWTHSVVDWCVGWNSGETMRFAPDRSAFSARLASLMPPAELAKAGSRAPKHQAAWLELQNLTRDWIELIAVTGRDLGYDALLANEVDRHRPGPPIACPLLIALNAKALTSPNWIFGSRGR